MAHLLKRRSKRPPPEPLDWRALANGPALRGLSDVLATPGAVASERAARRLALDLEEASKTPTVAQLPTVGVSDRVVLAAESSMAAALITTSLPDTLLPPLADVVTLTEDAAIETPTVVDSPTVYQSATVGVSNTMESQVSDRRNIPHVLIETAFLQTPTVAVSTTVGVSTSQAIHTTTIAAPAIDDTQSSELQTPTVGEIGPSEKSKVQAAGSSQWMDRAGNRIDSFRVIRVNIAQQSMTLGEERFYQVLWHAKDTDGVLHESPQSKTFSMGYDRLARLVRLDEKSIRQLIPRLAEKKILEVVAGENCSARVGKTYRIFSYEAILDRQRRTDMQFVVKRGRAVEFVWPLGSAVSPIRAVDTHSPPPHGHTPTVGVSPTVGDSPTESVGDTPPF